MAALKSYISGVACRAVSGIDVSVKPVCLRLWSCPDSPNSVSGLRSLISLDVVTVAFSVTLLTIVVFRPLFILCLSLSMNSLAIQACRLQVCPLSNHRSTSQVLNFTRCEQSLNLIACKQPRSGMLNSFLVFPPWLSYAILWKSLPVPIQPRLF